MDRGPELLVSSGGGSERLRVSEEASTWVTG